MERKTTVMAVDDSKVSLLTVKRHLADSAYDLKTPVQDAGSVLSTYTDTKPDVVLLDIVMPEIDGVTLLKQIKALDADATVIMVSSLASKEKVMECLDEGATSFLMKPYDQATLLKTLDAATRADAASPGGDA